MYKKLGSLFVIMALITPVSAEAARSRSRVQLSEDRVEIAIQKVCSRVDQANRKRCESRQRMRMEAGKTNNERVTRSFNRLNLLKNREKNRLVDLAEGKYVGKERKEYRRARGQSAKKRRASVQGDAVARRISARATCMRIQSHRAKSRCLSGLADSQRASQE